MEHRQVVAAHQDGRAFGLLLRHLHGRGGAQERGVRAVQHLHDFQVQGAHRQTLPKRHPQSILLGCGAVDLSQVVAQTENLLIDLGPLGLAVGGIPGQQVLGVVEVGACALQTIGAHLDDSEEVLIRHLRGSRQQARWLSSRQELLLGLRQLGRQSLGRRRHRLAAGLQPSLQLGDVGCQVLEVLLEAGVVEVHVRQGGEERLQHQVPDRRLCAALHVGQLAQAQSMQNRQVLQAAGLRRLLAHPRGRAALARVGLLALEAHHLRCSKILHLRSCNCRHVAITLSRTNSLKIYKSHRCQSAKMP
mmetsp:Transcript_74129/g.176752  ORF Transcript_74129/g.176752 Transcript_74129/m.176752 type:complete len:304 (-) Transcript_74129:9-920(-)